MICHLIQFGLEDVDIGVWVALTIVFSYCMLIGRNIEKSRMLLKLFWVFLAAVVVCEVFLKMSRKIFGSNPRGAEFILFGIEFVALPACLAFGFWFLFRYICMKKKSDCFGNKYEVFRPDEVEQGAEEQ